MLRRPHHLGSIVLTGSLCFVAATAAAHQTPSVRALTPTHALGPAASRSSRVRHDSDSVLYAFHGTPSGGSDGAYPYAGLLAHDGGTLFGTTADGGSAGKGIVFELIPSGSGGWTEDVIYAFQGGNDGASPYGGLLAKSGVLYGTTARGGSANQGTVFKLTRSHGGRHYTESVLYTFLGGEDGAAPEAGLRMDASGALYGTTANGGFESSSGGLCGTSGCGTVFKLTPSGSGEYTKSIIHTFTGADGANPFAGLLVGKMGALYGTTVHGGGLGNVFVLHPAASGTYTESVLYKFHGTEGAQPYGGLIRIGGALYGTTVEGGAYNSGSVFKLTPAGHGNYTQSVLYTFQGCGFSSPSCDASDPYAGVIADSSGNLYGTTYYGAGPGKGTVFKLTRSSSGDSYTESLLYAFQGGSDGAYPEDALIEVSGVLYGTTFYGGNSGSGTCGNGCGTVFSLNP